MNATLKVVIVVGAGLLVGFVVGYGLGVSGRGEAERAAKQEKVRADEAEASLKSEQEQCSHRTKACKRSRQLQQVKEYLLRAALELQVSNYGLTSQLLSKARTRLRAAEKGLKKRHLKLSRALYVKIGQAQTLVLKLDPMARTLIDQVLRELQRLPGAR